MSHRFTGKVALITGGSSGIGRATAQALAREGAAVYVTGRDLAALEQTAKSIADEGGTVAAMAGDVTVEDDVRAVVTAAVRRFGALDVAVNAAGVLGTVAPLADVDEPSWQRIIGANLTGVFLPMKHEIERMRGRGGSIVNVASNIGAHRRAPGVGPYVAAKAAVSALSRNTAREYIGDGIRINAVSPGASDTTMSLSPGETPDDRAARLADSVPLGRVGSLDEVVSAVLWLASDESGFAVGHDLVVDGGVTA
ncbi:SDR family NAD(P)-dependent oxidoreductase [Pseudonocardia alaniniphila]|uniref:Glucose 1-dehydrogenase n=1 Tax=Pseudonocardia alaniniphila TaxID=75291 RepID=A0ABS9TUZ7_9PSEU|nr:glucose 1-dehydrogenase [Pseudonocardia alaniniphila]MCH6172056.1 glucose 1-dehydrogenase [Pseudonocardia alaniniphila]